MGRRLRQVGTVGADGADREREAEMPGGKEQLRAGRGAGAWGHNSVGGFCSVHTKPHSKSLFLKVIGKNLFLATQRAKIPRRLR